MDASTGTRPCIEKHFIWKKLLGKSIMKSVDDGSKTRVWIDKWVLDRAPRRTYNKQTTMNLNLMVAQLINSEGTWDVELLRELCVQEDIDRILSFSPAICSEDEWIWAHTKEGVYTMKSGSWLQSQPISSMVYVPLQRRIINVKTRLWKIKKLPKIRMFYVESDVGCISGS